MAGNRGEENGNTSAVQLAGLGKYKPHLSHPRHGVSWGEGACHLQIFSLGHAELPLGGGEEVLHTGGKVTTELLAGQPAGQVRLSSA